MPITINIYYTGLGNAAKEFATEMISSGIVSEIREKKGNLKYDYFFPFDDHETILLIDRWENQEALDEHHHSPIMTKIMSLREKYKLQMRVERYVEDDYQIPKGDEKYSQVEIR
ncbi:putative quinol monooxygenase [Streptococcus plurextorum]|uniref:putative quinol monooxygenase n=1 Tax=Streptococcus plurextorum TaxID=456876 RepID=UPI000416C8E5|nr:antibiotic biosynthesis monooxygenase [Streptococcus plurextorum]